MLLKGTGPSPFLCVIPASEKVLHNTRMTAPPLMSPRMVRSSLSLCRLPAAALGNGYIKANSRHLSYLLGSSFDNYRKAPQWLSSVSYQGSERLRLSTAGERAASAFVRGWGGSSWARLSSGSKCSKCFHLHHRVQCRARGASRKFETNLLPVD